MICTVLNERDTIGPLVRSLLGQTRRPDEITIADAGSTDGTREILHALTAASSLVRAMDAPGGRSTGRNAAIRAATHDVIACIDAGCVAEPTWLEHLLAPFSDGARWVGGFYRPAGRSTKATCLGLVVVYVREEVDEDGFLPSARSMAFVRLAWEAVGGFPEDLDYAEDTLFDERLLAAGYRPVFAGEAVVRWSPPSSYRQLARTLYRWGHGDGVAGLRGGTYRRLLAVYGATVAAVVLGLAVDRRLVPVAVAPLGVSVARRTRHKYRHADGWSRFVHIPVAHVTANVAALTGFLRGRRSRRERRDGTP
ncbi:MAG: glycosyltransferase [Actinobacteria bacterium]|nr:glycosyltransferase [Actinomycetota bacterium]